MLIYIDEPIVVDRKPKDRVEQYGGLMVDRCWAPD